MKDQHQCCADKVELEKDREYLKAHIVELKAENESYRTAIAFETTCLNCARITERLAYAESIIAELKQLTKEDNE